MSQRIIWAHYMMHIVYVDENYICGNMDIYLLLGLNMPTMQTNYHQNFEMAQHLFRHTVSILPLKRMNVMNLKTKNFHHYYYNYKYHYG